MNEFLPIILDLVVVFVFIFYLARGWKRGFARTVVSMLSWLLALFLAWELYGYVADFLRATGVQASLASSLGAGIKAPLKPGMAEATSFIEGLFLPEALKNSIVGNNNYEAYLALGVDSFSEYIGTFLASTVVNAISLLIVFVIALLLLRIVARWLGAVNWIPLLGTVNRVLGVVANGLVGYFVIHIWMFVFTLLATGQNVFSTIVMAMERGAVSSLFYDSNLLLEWITKILN